MAQTSECLIFFLICKFRVLQVQLAVISVPLALISCFVKDYEEVTELGFFSGYTTFTVFLVMQHIMGGLIVALVVKYADNILKGEAGKNGLHFRSFTCRICHVFGDYFVLRGLLPGVLCEPQLRVCVRLSGRHCLRLLVQSEAGRDTTETWIYSAEGLATRGGELRTNIGEL